MARLKHAWRSPLLAHNVRSLLAQRSHLLAPVTGSTRSASGKALREYNLIVCPIAPVYRNQQAGGAYGILYTCAHPQEVRLVVLKLRLRPVLGRSLHLV